MYHSILYIMYMYESKSILFARRNQKRIKWRQNNILMKLKNEIFKTIIALCYNKGNALGNWKVQAVNKNEHSEM